MTALNETPFAAVTFIAAPALLTNASCLLANSVTQRFLRTREIMRELYGRSRLPDLTSDDHDLILEEVDRVEIQVSHLLNALYAVYVAVGDFAGATLITLVGAGIAVAFGTNLTMFLAWIGILLGTLGVGGLVFGSYHLIHATKVSLANILAEAKRIRSARP